MLKWSDEVDLGRMLQVPLCMSCGDERHNEQEHSILVRSGEHTNPNALLKLVSVISINLLCS